MSERKVTTLQLEADGNEDGSLRAVFSTFGIVDSDNDVVMASAFTDGQTVPLVWAHDWTRIIGKGVIEVQPDRAVFNGGLFTDTHDGLEAYRTLKNMVDLMEFSWAFNPLETHRESRDGRNIRVITRSEVFEVSPVLVGANRETGILDLKGRYPSFEAQIEAVLAAVLDVKERAGSLAELRAKEGRMISTARRERLAKFPPALREMADDIFGMLEETAPPEKGIDTAEVERFLLWSLRRNGVAV